MSVIDTIDEFDKLEFNDLHSFAITSALIAESIQQYNTNPLTRFNEVNVLWETNLPDIVLRQQAIERQCSETNNETIPFTTILSSCLDQSSSSDLCNIFQRSLYIPFRANQPTDYEPIQWQADPSAPIHFAVQPIVAHQSRNELINNDNIDIVTLDGNNRRNYVDAVDDEKTNEVPKVVIKKKGKKKKQPVNTVETSDNTSIQLNTSSNRTSSAGHKYPQKLSSKWSSGKRISAMGIGKTSLIRKIARPSHDRSNSRTLFRSKPSVTSNTSRLSQEQREQLTRAAEERKQEERKRKVEKLNDQAKKREDVLNRAKQIQQEKDQKNQLRTSDNQSKNTSINQNKKVQGNNSINESTISAKPIPQQYKPVTLDITSNKILKNPTNPVKKQTTTNAPYASVVDKNNPVRNEIALPSSSMAQSKADWTISPTSEISDDELETTITDTTHCSDDGNYGIQDIHSDHDSDNDDEDETRIPSWAKEHLLKTFWKTQGHWCMSRRTLKLTRRTFGHYPIIKDQLQLWLKDLKSSKPLSETFSDATYLDQTQVYF